MKIYTNVDLKKNRITNAKIQTTQPDTPWSEGLIYLDTTTDKIMYYDGNGWVAIGGGGGGQDNIIEGIKVNETNLSLNNKVASVSFSSTGSGELTIKDKNNDTLIQTITIGNTGITAGAIVAAGTLNSGYSTYIIKHSLGTDNVVVQVIDDGGSTIICEVTRYNTNNEEDHFVLLEFSQVLDKNYTVVLIGNPKGSETTITTQ